MSELPTVEQAEATGATFTDVGPHDWQPARRSLLGWLFDVTTYCEACYLAEFDHPVERWAEARPYGDTTIRPPRYAPYDRGAGVRRV